MSVLIICLMATVMYFAVSMNFKEFVTKKELGELDNIVHALEEIYDRNHGWNSLINDHNAWHRMIQTAAPAKERNNGIKTTPPPRLHPAPPPHHPTNHEGRQLTPLMQHPPQPDFESERINLPMRLCLLNRNKQHIAGQFHGDRRYAFRDIVVNGEIAAILGLEIIEKRRHPFEIDFLAAQKKGFLMMGGGVFLLSALLSYLLARQMLSPITELLNGINAMKTLDFNFKLNTRSHDELGKLVEHFNAMALTLNKYETMRKQWISDISHELRTPLSALRAKIEAVQDGIRPMTPEMLESLHINVMQLAKLVEDLHYLSIHDSDNLTLQNDYPDILSITRDTINSFQEKMESSQIRCSLNIADDTVPVIAGNRNSLERLFFNIVENSIRYTNSPGYLEINVSTSKTHAIISFEDSAPGVPDHALELIFNRLFRVEKSRSRELGGSGLGLSICKQIVEKHQGEISASHSSHGGLKITVQLPLLKGTKHYIDISHRP
ncbi:ATP-binding protein [Desulfamplus magnetovallimortis]|nr:ATP-binding protein [Desulfamplus magnetovallimortis]